ncbi:uncharacterized protein N0V89_010125 [Didymosphaeria variabile]|uniref:Protein kinase domain-containing protein n=1 Tax=Didymosphaeria variabile TaxID=1932322 RepID=A0A9W9C785_9PLEO|nr:uncharacterized protein N0V89_010125 [Didymosphaeria variabile]KAJ4348747.1 hypothetical protein N0V89_010125 [Didymosphaeria variabile]
MEELDLRPQGLEALYTKWNPVQTIHSLVEDTAFQISDKATAITLHDNLIRLKNWASEIFVEGLSDFEASNQELVRVLCEHVETIGRSLIDIKDAISKRDTTVIDDRLKSLDATIEELLEDSDPTIVAIEIAQKQGTSGRLIQSIQRRTLGQGVRPRSDHDERMSGDSQTRTMTVRRRMRQPQKELADELTMGMRRSEFDKTPFSFLPKSELDRLITVESAMRAMSIKVPTLDDEKLLHYIVTDAKAIFATAVYIKLKPDKLHEAMTLFRQYSPRFRDDALPIKEKSGADLLKEADDCFERLAKGLTDMEYQEKEEELLRKAITGVQHILRTIEGPVQSDDDRIWTDGRIIEFQEDQKHFCAPIIQDTEISHDLFGVAIPFVEKYATRGAGSYGVVSKYRIHHDHIVSSRPSDGASYEVVAVKELKPDTHKDAQELSRHWASEVRAMAMMNTLDHKGHIVHFVTAFRRGSRALPEHYLITEWADGGNLEDLWKSMPKPQLTERTVQSVIRQLLGLAEAFNAAHNLKSGGVTTGASYRHGDLKPANILWFKPKPRDNHNYVIGTLKICDWGEAKNKTFATVMRHSKTTAGVSTRRYQPPEVDTGIHLSISGESKRRSRLYDMWAMGCIILQTIVWLLYGYEGLEKFNASVRNELNDDSPFYQTGDVEGRRMAWVHNVVEHWMGHMAKDAACRAGTTALGDLLEIVQRGLLKVKLPVSGGTFVEQAQPQPGAITQPQLENLMRPSRIRITGPEKPGQPHHDTEGSNLARLNTPLHDAVVDHSPEIPVVNVISPDEDETDVQPKFLLPGPARYRADELRDGLLSIASDEEEYWCTKSNTDVPAITGSLYARGPTHSVLRRLQDQEQEVDYGKTSIETERWSFKSDNDFASRVLSEVQSNVDFPVPAISADADFKEEAKYMEEVYSGARCVIAASRANGHKDGFLKPRKERGYVGLQREQESNAPFYICEMIDNFEEHILGGSLNQRGWVLQEHALARRTIFFDEHQTYWECGHGVRCETMTKLDNEAAKLLGDPNFPKLLDSAKQAERIIRFEELYQQYSRLGLSKQYDRPTALAGLEQRLHRTMRVKGRFGMFDDSKAPGLLRRSLLWHRGKDTKGLTRIKFLPTQTPAPSWSWMAWTGTKIDDYKYTPGGINYFQVPFKEFDWEDVQTPWMRRDLDEENALSVDARAFDCTSARKEQYTFIGDSQKGSAPKWGMCVVLGIQIGSLMAIDKQHYVLLIARTGKMDSNGLQRWERIGAGWLLGEFLKNDVIGVKVY